MGLTFIIPETTTKPAADQSKIAHTEEEPKGKKEEELSAQEGEENPIGRKRIFKSANKIQFHSAADRLTSRNFVGVTEARLGRGQVELRCRTEGLDRWPENVMAIYRCLLQNPAVDPDRVFLYAASGETEHVCKLLATNCAPWKGIIFFNPVELPDLKHLPYTQPIPKFYFSLGGLEGRDNKIKAFKEEALFHGIAVDYRIHPNEGHWLVGTSAVHERIAGMLRFVFDDH